MADVLLVDDNGSVRLVMATALRRCGHTVTVAVDAQQALKHLQRHRFTFLVSDVRMAGMNGIELAVRARQLPHPPRIILMSAHPNIEAHEGLAEAFLRKPIDFQELHALLCAQDAVNTPASNRNGNSPPTAAAQSSVRSESAPSGSAPAKCHTAPEGRDSTCDASAQAASSRRAVRASYGTIFG
jgi:CheY-like chemotaxis protein